MNRLAEAASGQGRAYYNEIDADAVAILRELIAADVIAPGDVDTRSIRDISPDDLRDYTQCHFFAGGGLWSIAARLAGWPDHRPLWTGSCPCQGESVAGKKLGADDPRHLWPDLYRLIRARRPAIVMGEQVARAAGTHWLDRVCADLENEDYSVRAVDIPACAVDAPQQRQRLWWIAVEYAESERWRQGRPEHELWRRRSAAAISDGAGTLGGAGSAGLPTPELEAILGAGRRSEGRATEQSDGALPYRNGSWWADAEWIPCHDGKARRAQPRAPLLVAGLPGRVGLWRVAGNAISPILASEVIGAFLDAE